MKPAVWLTALGVAGAVAATVVLSRPPAKKPETAAATAARTRPAGPLVPPRPVAAARRNFAPPPMPPGNRLGGPPPNQPPPAPPPAADRNAAPPNLQADAQPITDASLACACPPLPTVPKEQQPKDGYVFRELRADDFDVLFSNREFYYGFDWRKTLDDLTNAIDPTGALGLGGRPSHPRVNEDVPLKEGMLSEVLISGPRQCPGPFGGPPILQLEPYFCDVWAKRVPMPWHAHQDYKNDRLDSQIVGPALIQTIARANKYGEPELGGRRKALIAAQWLAGLIPCSGCASLDVTGLDFRTHPGQILAQSRRMQGTLADAILAGITGTTPQWARWGMPLTTNLEVDDIDRANAALDVLVYTDPLDRGEYRLRLPAIPVRDPGRIPGGPSDDPTVIHNILGRVLSLAAQRREFGGTAVPGSRLDAIACKALNVLIALGDQRHPNSRYVRAALTEDFHNPAVYDKHQFPFLPTLSPITPEHEKAKMRVVRRILLNTRFAADEGPQIADAITYGLSTPWAFRQPPINAEEAAIIAENEEILQWAKDLTGPVPGVPDAGRVAYAKEFDNTVTTIVKPHRDAALNRTMQPATPDVYGLVPRWYAATVTDVGAPSSQVCIAGSCAVKIEREKPANPDVPSKAYPDILVQSLLRRTEDTADSLTVSEPFVITVRLRADDAQGHGNTLQVIIQSEQNAASMLGNFGSWLKGARTDVFLQRVAANEPGVAVYRTVKPLTFAAGGEGALADPDASHPGVWLMRKLLGYGPTDMTKLKTADGDTVTFSVPSEDLIPAQLLAFPNEAKQQIDRNERSFTALYGIYGAKLHDPAATAIERDWAATRMAFIGNARAIVMHQPKPDEDFTDISRAMVGIAYLGLIQTDVRTLDQGRGGTDRFKGPDDRFGVTYKFGEERQQVDAALHDAHDKMSLLAFKQLVHLEIETYRAYLAATCDLMREASAGLAPCADQLWIIAEGTTSTGETVDGWGRAVTGFQVLWPWVKATDEGQALREYFEQKIDHELNRAFDPKQADAVDQQKADAVKLTRRSEDVDAAQKKDPGGSTVETVDVPASEFSTTGTPVAGFPTLSVKRHLTGTVPGARLFTQLLGRKFDLQIYDDTCLLTVIRWFRQRAGLPVTTQAKFVRNVIEWGRRASAAGLPSTHSTRSYTVYEPGTGSRVDRASIMLLSKGVDVKDAQLLNKPGLGVADMRFGLQQGYDVVAIVKNHAVAVIQIKNGQVVYGDPWNGLYWVADECAFDAALNKSETMFLKWR